VQAAKVRKARGASKPKKGKEGFRETPLPKWHSVTIGAVEILVKTLLTPGVRRWKVRPNVLRIDDLEASKRGYRETLFSPKQGIILDRSA